MKILIAVLFAIGICAEVGAQSAPQIFLGNNIQPFPRGSVSTFPGPPPGLEGSFYLYDGWSVGTILLGDDKVLADIPVKLDLQNSLLEIDHNGQTKVLIFDRVKALDLKLLNGKIEHFVNGKTLKFTGTPMEGLFSFVTGGNYNLLCLTRAKKLRPDYNVALQLGSKDFRIVKEKKYFIMKDDVIVEVGNAKKKLAEELQSAFNDQFDQKLKKVKLNKEESLLEFVTALNSNM